MPESPICGFSFREKMKQWRTHRATIAQAAEIPSGGLDESRKLPSGIAPGFRFAPAMRLCCIDIQ
jgi:hypothetical protein